LVACGALELVAVAVRALHRCLSALGVFADGVPCTPRAFRLAALAAWRIACVSAAPTALSLAWKAIPIDILAADIMLAHTGTAAALVSGSAFEPGSVVVRALHRCLSALGVFADGVPCTLRAFGLAALAAWCSACVSAATATIPLAWETVPQDILAANIFLAHASVATALVASGALELVAVAVRALHRCLSALGVFADGVPCTPRAFRLAALAAWRIACVSAAPTALSLARKAVPIDVLAADIMLAHTGTATALVSGSTFEPGPVGIPALHRRLATS